MAAVGVGGGNAWVEPPLAEHEALILEAVKLAVELGVDVNAVNTDGKTALDAAKTFSYKAVVEYLTASTATPRPGAAP
jgi:ankyrin repeat protein